MTRSSSSSSSSADSIPINTNASFDLKKYQQPELVAALDRLTSFTYATSLLVKPALKIVWRSLIYDDAQLRLNELLGKLSGSSPITSPPTSQEKQERVEAVVNAQRDQKHPAAAGGEKRRTLQERIVHFVLVGLPLAILVGIAAGLINFVTAIWSDIMIVQSLSNKLFVAAKDDAAYWRDHPESRPTKEQAVRAWSSQIVQPYSSMLVKKKLGFLSFLSAPFVSIINVIVSRAANNAAQLMEVFGAKRGFSPFRADPLHG